MAVTFSGSRPLERLQVSVAAAVFVGLADTTGLADAGEDPADGDTSVFAVAFGEAMTARRGDALAAPVPALLATRTMAEAAASALPEPACAAPLRLTGSPSLSDSSAAWGWPFPANPETVAPAAS